MAFCIHDIQLSILNISYKYLLNLLWYISLINSLVKNTIFRKENMGMLISKVFYSVA